MFHVPEKFRFTNPGLGMGSDSSFGNNGVFEIPFESYLLKMIVSDGMGWEHVSVSLKNRCPDWREMCFVKKIFWDPWDAVVQYHPPESKYANNHPFCLHLWRPIGKEVPIPETYLVGIKPEAPQER